MSWTFPPKIRPLDQYTIPDEQVAPYTTDATYMRAYKTTWVPNEAERTLLTEIYRATAEAHAGNGAIKVRVSVHGCDIIVMNAPNP